MFFDVLTHPTIDGQWLNGAEGQTFEHSSRLVKSEGLVGACAVGLPSVGSYEPETYFREAVRNDFLPVAGFTARNQREVLPDLELIRDIGYRVVKIHPRLLGYHDKPELLQDVLTAAHALDLKVMLCTYPANQAGFLPTYDMFDVLSNSLNATPELSLLLVHGGVTDLLRYSLLARHCMNVFLDLSFTLMRYRKSSVGLDMKFVLEQLDQKTCIGSDHPEYSFSEVCSTLEGLTGSLPNDKRANALYRTAIKFLGI